MGAGGLLRTEHSEVLYQVARDVVHAATLHEVTQAALAGLGRLVSARSCAVATIDTTRDCYTVCGSTDQGAILGQAEPLGSLGADLRDLRQGSTVVQQRGRRVVVPVRDHALLLGAVVVERDRSVPPRAIRLVEEVASLIAEGMRRERMREDLVRAHDAARRANEQKTSFLNHVSHEIRTPLTAILGYLELIREEGSDLPPQDLFADLDRIHGAANHLLSLINDVLDLGKLEAGKLDLTLTTVDLVGLLEDVDDVVQPLVAQNHNRWSWTAPDEAWILGDPLRLRQVLLNLIGNAAKFTEHGAVSLQVHLTERAAHIDVIDTGMGIDEARLGELFEPFVQVHQNPSAYGGTGLGLAITKQYVEMMGGTISAQSEIGCGTTFRVELLRVVPERGG